MFRLVSRETCFKVSEMHAGGAAAAWHIRGVVLDSEGLASSPLGECQSRPLHRCIPWRRPNNGARCGLSSWSRFPSAFEHLLLLSPQCRATRVISIPTAPRLAFRTASSQLPRSTTHRILLPNLSSAAPLALPRARLKGFKGCAGTVQPLPSNVRGRWILPAPCSAHGSQPLHGFGNTCPNGRAYLGSSRR